MMRGPSTSSALLPAAPTRHRLEAPFPGRARPCSRRAAPRRRAIMFDAMRIWLTILVCWPGARPALVDDRLAHALEERRDGLDDVLVAADHDRQGRVLRADVAAGDRGIERCARPSPSPRRRSRRPATARSSSCPRGSCPACCRPARRRRRGTPRARPSGSRRWRRRRRTARRPPSACRPSAAPRSSSGWALSLLRL